MERDEILRQSKSAYQQWAEEWRKNALTHKGQATKSFEDFRNTGIGKAALLVANGYSFEENIETIIKNKDNVDIICCDKTLGHLLDHGIEPYICVVCDANVNYEKYLEPYKDRVNKTILFNNVCGNPDWSFKANWKSKYFYVNKDILNSENEFMAISGCRNAVTAGTNVSNMMVVLLLQSDNLVKQNLFSYDKMLLIGFDYSWKHDGKYYAFDKLANGKFHYMRHIYGMSVKRNIIYSSNNLNASASWMRKYVEVTRPPIVQCSEDSLMTLGKMGKLSQHIGYRHKPSDSKKVINMLSRRREIELQLKSIDNELGAIAKDHHLNYLGSL